MPDTKILARITEIRLSPNLPDPALFGRIVEGLQGRDIATIEDDRVPIGEVWVVGTSPEGFVVTAHLLLDSNRTPT